MVPDTNGVEGLEVSTRAFFKAHCLRCHDSEKQKGKFRLDNLSTDFTNPLVAEKWSEVRFRINAGEMPPEEEKQPTADEIGGVVDELTQRIREGSAQRLAKRGSLEHYRLSRQEYAHTVHDLFGVVYDVEAPGAFNEDPRLHGFDRIGAMLSVAPSHIERYLEAAEAVVGQALADSDTPTKTSRSSAGEGKRRLLQLGEGWGFDLKHSGRYRLRIRASGLPAFTGRIPRLSIWHRHHKRPFDGVALVDYSQPTHFDSLTSLFPEERFVLEGADDGAGLATRVVGLVAPLGKGQRGLIVAPPRGGKTILLKQIAKSIQLNSPETELVILLLDERPEEVTDFEEMVGQNVFASTFDEPSKRHAEVANLVLERSRRLVEQGKDVVILLDSLTRLARGYNNASRGGPIGSGGVSPRAITETRKFFGAARNIEEGGSLTILATCLIETESRMDDVIFEELKGTGNMEVRLDRELAEQRIYPAIHIPQSGTRNDDRLYHSDELPRVQEIRRHLASLPIGEAIDTLLRNLARTKTNTELLLQGMR